MGAEGSIHHAFSFFMIRGVYHALCSMHFHYWHSTRNKSHSNDSHDQKNSFFFFYHPLPPYPSTHTAVRTPAELIKVPNRNPDTFPHSHLRRSLQKVRTVVSEEVQQQLGVPYLTHPKLVPQTSFSTAKQQCEKINTWSGEIWILQLKWSHVEIKLPSIITEACQSTFFLLIFSNLKASTQ